MSVSISVSSRDVTVFGYEVLPWLGCGPVTVGAERAAKAGPLLLPTE